MTANKSLFRDTPIRCVGSFGGESGKALVFASPFVVALVVVAQTHPFSFLCIVGNGQTDGQGQVQFGDELAFAVQKGDV